jgi:CDP-glucose 4,6-dehydratase
LDWRPPVSLSQALDSIVDWHEAQVAGADMRAETLAQLERFLDTTG